MRVTQDTHTHTPSLSPLPHVPTHARTHLELRLLGGPRQRSELELDGARLGRADLDEGAATRLEVDARARDLGGSAEARVQVVPQVKLQKDDVRVSLGGGVSQGVVG